MKPPWKKGTHIDSPLTSCDDREALERLSATLSEDLTSLSSLAGHLLAKGCPFKKGGYNVMARNGFRMQRTATFEHCFWLMQNM